jgi:hypothetical protein
VWNEYAREKLHEIDAELARKKLARPRPEPQCPDREYRRLAPVARAAGRRVRRLGEALESWADVSRPRRTRSWREGGTG